MSDFDEGFFETLFKKDLFYNREPIWESTSGARHAEEKVPHVPLYIEHKLDPEERLLRGKAFTLLASIHTDWGGPNSLNILSCR